MRGVSGSRGPIVGAVAAYVPGFSPAGEEVPAVSEGDVVEARIELWPAATVMGRVVDAKGDGVAGVQAWSWVETRQGKAFPGWTSPGVPSALIRTGADGRFSIAVVRAHRSEPTRVKVLVWRSLAFEGSGAPLAVDERTEVKGSVRAGETLDLGDILLPTTDAPSAAVRVRDRSGAPVRGARVQIVAQHDRNVKPTDEEGRTRLWWPTWQGETLAEMRAITVDAPGFARELVRVEPRRATTVDVDVVLGPAHRVAGRVLDENGLPAVGRWILVANGRVPLDRVLPADHPLDTTAYFRQAFDAEGPLYLGETNTDADGRFEVPGIPEGPYHVGTSGEGGRMISAAGVATDSTEVALRVPVAPVVPSVSFEGVAVDGASGTPVLRPLATLVSDAGTVEATVPTVGVFRFDGVLPGTYTLRVRGDGYVERSFPALHVDGVLPDPFRVELTCGAALFGRVSPPPGLSLRDRTITLRERRSDGHVGATHGARLKPDGSYRVIGLAPGRFRVWVYPPSVPQPESPVLVPADAEDVTIEPGAAETRRDLVVVAAGNLQVHLADDRLPKAGAPEGSRDEGAEVYGAACRVIVRDAQGRELARVEGLRLGQWDDASYGMLPAGRYRVRYEAPGAPPAEVEAEVKAAGQTEVTLPEAKR